MELKIYSKLVILVALTSGCSSIGKQISSDVAKQVKVGVTTESELVKLVGPANMSSDQVQMGQLPKTCGAKNVQVKMLMYNYVEQAFRSSRSESKAYYVNGNGIVCHTSSTEMNPGTPTFW